MATASLELLKGAKKAPVAVVAKPAPEPVETEVSVDVDELNSDQLDALVADQEIETPAEWAEWKAPAKREWLKSQFEEDTEAEAVKAAEPVPAPKKGKSAKKAEAALEAAGEPKTKGKAAKAPPANIEGDVLAEIVHVVENIEKKPCLALAQQLDESTSLGMFKLGGLMARVQKEGWYEPYATFKEWTKAELGIGDRATSYWLSTYKVLSKGEIPWSKVEKLGWTKLSRIAEILTKENLDEWIKIATKNTVVSLEEIVRAHKKGKPVELTEEGGAVKETGVLTFKVHADQKATIKSALEKAKEIHGTKVDTVALDAIAQDFLSGTTSFNLVKHLKGIGLEAALDALEKAFPHVTLTAEVGEESEAA